VGSVGGATLETVRRYVESQGTTEKAGRRKTKPPDCPPLALRAKKGNARADVQSVSLQKILLSK
ncbi:MAG: hypothetical protein M0Z37_01940, partial [Nitrospiraceae bacterium]|nr:hypothetical protein [Nitrospiraceae bacterium]